MKSKNIEKIIACVQKLCKLSAKNKKMLKIVIVSVLPKYFSCHS